MSRLKPGDIVTMNDAGVEHMGTFPHMKTLRSLVIEVEEIPDTGLYSIEVAGCDGKPNDLSPFMLIDIHFDKVT